MSASSSQSIGTFYGLPSNGRNSRIIVVAHYAELPMDVKVTSVYKNDHLTEEYLSMFPYGKVPGFKGPNGFTLVENRAIARYVASLAKGYNLLGNDEESSALIEQWIDFVDEELFKIGIQFHQQVMAPTKNEEEVEKSRKNLDRAMKYLESNLKQQKTSLVGTEITLADLTMATALHAMFTKIMGSKGRSLYPNTVHFYQNIVQIPKIANLFKENGELLQEDR